MVRFVPKDKLSKKAQKELNRQRRTMWDFSPVSRTVGSKKRYNRKRNTRDRYDDYGAGVFHWVYTGFLMDFLPDESRGIPDFINHMRVGVDSAHLTEIRILQNRSGRSFLPDLYIPENNILDWFLGDSRHVGAPRAVFGSQNIRKKNTSQGSGPGRRIRNGRPGVPWAVSAPGKFAGLPCPFISYLPRFQWTLSGGCFRSHR